MRGWGCGIQSERPHDLPKLLHHMIAFDEKVGGQRTTLEQAGIPRQENAALALSQAEQVIVFTRKILGIIAKDAQPTRQPP